MMNTPAYEKLIEDLCESAGIAGWAEVASSRHVQVGNQLIGFIPVLHGDVPSLSIYVELGQTFPERDTAIYQRLLAANLQSDPELLGHFGLHPESHQAVYKFSVGLETMRGVELAGLLDTQAGLATRCMQALMEAT